MMNNSCKIPYRFFWSWDHSTNWVLNVPGEQVTGVCNPYCKESELFEMDYKHVIDWCSEHKMTATGIVGMLRDRHGGVDAARRVCSYAREKGTLVYLIAGLFAYGGIYYEGDHKYSLNRFFEKNPDAIAKAPDGSNVAVKYKGRYGVKDELQGCASNPYLHEFILESLDWLFRKIPELGGIQMESTDNGVCSCPACLKRRGVASLDEPISLADMAAIYPDASETIRRVNPDALIICETYHHFLDKECSIFAEKSPSPDLEKLLSMPETTFWQWKCDQMLKDGEWREGDEMIENMKRFRHIIRAHSGTQWWGGRNTFAVDNIRRQCLLSHSSGIDAVSMFGETSPYHSNIEFNYLALEYFADNPHNTNEDFISDVMADRLGGKANAETYFEYAHLFRNDYKRIPTAVSDIAKITASLSDYAAIRRFNYLSHFLNAYYWELSRGTNMSIMIPRDSDRFDQA